jgi:hypothetical protein
MEPKVIQTAMLGGKGKWHYSKLGQLTRQSGSGNNWAMGYQFHGPQVRDQAMNMVRRQASGSWNLCVLYCHGALCRSVAADGQILVSNYCSVLCMYCFLAAAAVGPAGSPHMPALARALLRWAAV